MSGPVRISRGFIDSNELEVYIDILNNVETEYKDLINKMNKKLYHSAGGCENLDLEALKNINPL